MTDAPSGGYQPPVDDRPLGSTSSDPLGMDAGATTGAGTGDFGTSPSGSSTSTAKEAGGQVASTAADQAKNVAGEAKTQARNLMDETQTQVREQAGTQKDKAAGSLRGISDELRSLADGTSTGQSGMVNDFSRQASDKLQDLAQWLESRDPGDLVNDVRDFARRRPGAFLLGAAVTGAIAGRLTRGAVDAKRSESDDVSGWSSTRDSTAYSSPSTTGSPARDDVLLVEDPVSVESDPFGSRPERSSVGGDRL